MVSSCNGTETFVFKSGPCYCAAVLNDKDRCQRRLGRGSRRGCGRRTQEVLSTSAAQPAAATPSYASIPRSPPSALAQVSSALFLPTLALISPGLLLVPTPPQNSPPTPPTPPWKEARQQHPQRFPPFIRLPPPPCRQALGIRARGPPAQSDVNAPA